MALGTKTCVFVKELLQKEGLAKDVAREVWIVVNPDVQCGYYRTGCKLDTNNCKRMITKYVIFTNGAGFFRFAFRLVGTAGGFSFSLCICQPKEHGSELPS